eukprot:CAMPEP_0178951284 /NCGR_PEP_ID=MMETSP0789-20121207/7133_1 /TAXON_ID=3005 /ORGANISM="Rhizosolenia setigera, Strain CCMP 1694" /LENGTH=796 /DNA_ID=CAMNT_0020632125 /DNA_START=79 /DNA_END=2469 /DNA_ORIENTATION=+
MGRIFLGKKKPSTKSTGSPSLEMSQAQSEKKFQYNLKVDPSQNDKATEVKVLSFARPHMRDNVAHRAAVLLWFSINPLILRIQESLGVDDTTIWLSIVSTLSGSLISRLVGGFVVDKYGARLPFAGILLLTCVPCLCLGIVQTGLELIVVRFFLGIAGGAFVMVHAWLEEMFTEENTGFVHGFSGGIGAVNGMANFCIGTICFPMITKITGSPELGWRLSFIPASLTTTVVALMVIFASDDTPPGNVSKFKKTGYLKREDDQFLRALRSINVWIIGVQYACNFGVEIVLYNKATAYLQTHAGLGEITATVVAACSTGSNQVLRVMAGRLSDRKHRESGIHGRIRLQMVLVSLSGLSIFPFAVAGSPAGIICSLYLVMFVLSAAQGATFSLVTVLDKKFQGSAFGLIGAIGNFVAVLFALMFVYRPFSQSLMAMGGFMITSSVLSIFLEEADDVDSLDVIPKSVSRVGLSEGPRGRRQSIFHTLTASHERSMFGHQSSGKNFTNKSLRLQQEGWMVHLDNLCTRCNRALMRKGGSSALLCISCDISDTTVDDGNFLSDDGSLALDSLQDNYHDSTRGSTASPRTVTTRKQPGPRGSTASPRTVTSRKRPGLTKTGQTGKSIRDLFSGGMGISSRALTTFGNNSREMIANVGMSSRNLFAPTGAFGAGERIPSEIEIILDAETLGDTLGENCLSVHSAESSHKSSSSSDSDDEPQLKSARGAPQDRFSSIVAVAPPMGDSMSDLRQSLRQVLESRNIKRKVSENEIENFIKRLSYIVDEEEEDSENDDDTGCDNLDNV